MSLSFQWLGTASLVLKDGDQILAIDPFLTRPSIQSMLHPLASDCILVAKYLPECNYLLVTHAHYDHLLDAAEIMRQTGAAAYGSDNTCQLLAASGAPISHTTKVSVGDRLSLGRFHVEVIHGQHSSIPFGRLFNGPLRAAAKPPLYAWDYRMDMCLGLLHHRPGHPHIGLCSRPQPADLWFLVAQEPQSYYRALLLGVQPQVLIPIHWDNFTRPLTKPLRRFHRPGRLSLGQLELLVHQTVPDCQVLVPELSMEYAITGLNRQNSSSSIECLPVPTNRQSDQ